MVAGCKQVHEAHSGNSHCCAVDALQELSAVPDKEVTSLNNLDSGANGSPSKLISHVATVRPRLPCTSAQAARAAGAVGAARQGSPLRPGLDVRLGGCPGPDGGSAGERARRAGAACPPGVVA